MTSTVAVLPAPLPLRTRAGALARRFTAFRLGVAAIALHVIDDAFLQPQPGTSAGDHLVTGLVPLALLALAAWAIHAAERRPPRRARPGARRARPRGGRRGLLLRQRDRPVGRRLHRPARAGRRARAARRRRRHALAHPPDGRQPAPPRRPPHAARRRRRAHVRLRRAADRHGVRRHAHGARRGACRRPRRPARGRPLHHERRARAARLVRALAQRRRGDRLPGPQGPAGVGAHARPPRLRRAALRPPRRGRERRRSQRLGLGRRPRPAGRDRLPRRPVPTSTPTGSAGSACPSAAS